MGTLYLATDPIPLAGKLADLLDHRNQAGDPFTPVNVVIPNRYLGKWLKLWLARRHGVVINLRFTYLETALWDMLRAVDPRTHAAEPEMLDGDRYRLLVLAVLLGEDDPDLAPLRDYLQCGVEDLSRRSCRRAWHLADKLGSLIRDYEYHRQDALIQPWIKDKLTLGASSYLAALERSQRSVFHHIIRLPDGKRELLIRATSRNFKTLPQYSMEVLEELQKPPRPRVESSRPADPEVYHLFGITQISAMHVHTLHWLGRYFDLRLYHLNPLVARLPREVSSQAIASLADLHRGGASGAAPPAAELLNAWASAGAESLCLMGQLLGEPAGLAGSTAGASGAASRFQVERLLSSRPARTAKKPRLAPGAKRQAQGETVLQRLQRHILNEPEGGNKLDQDASLQIIGCPGVMREVETAYNSILSNLKNNPDLKQTDIAVLVTDMGRYRPALQAVFGRPPRPLRFNLADYSAAGLSTFGRALLGMLDLALESFTRSAVLEVLGNPCFLARLGADRAQAATWLRWAKELGIHQGWDQDDKREQGYPASPRYGWRLGLQRLRLGRFMDTTPASDDRPAPRFGHLIPFADIDSRDREQLDIFSRGVEGLLTALARLRKQRGSGRTWAGLIRNLVHTFLDVPHDRPEEGQVRERILAALDQLPLWDQLFVEPSGLPSPLRGRGVGGEGAPTLSLPLIREFIAGNLEGIEGGTGEYLTGGVTISALQPMRPVPFEIIYLLGMGEDLFPGSNQLSPFDLRNAMRLPGDIRPAEHNRYLFLEALLAARRKLYILFNNRDLQRDQDLLPAVCVGQLQRYLTEHMVAADFTLGRAPLHYHDPECLAVSREEAVHDAGISFSETDRLLALEQASDRLQLDLNQVADWKELLARRRVDFSLPADRAADRRVPSVTIKDLKRFLENPALASLKRHLRLIDEEEDDTAATDDEPLVSTPLAGHRLIRQVLHSFVLQATRQSVEQALADWPRRFEQLYRDEGLRCQVPDDAFGAVDQAVLHADLQARIDDSLAEFMRGRNPGAFCGPVLLGESLTPLGARVRFPALNFSLARPLPAYASGQARLSGFSTLAWHDDEGFDLLILTGKADLDPELLSPYLFEPVLLYLAILAGADVGTPGVCGRDWLGGCDLNVYVSCRNELHSFSYEASALTPALAEAYLAHLVTDFLDPAAYDLLPFDVIIGDRPRYGPKLADAFLLEDHELGNLADVYFHQLEEKIEEARERNFNNFWNSPLLELASARVPADAFAKIRRRFKLLDIGPAGQRK